MQYHKMKLTFYGPSENIPFSSTFVTTLILKGFNKEPC